MTARTVAEEVPLACPFGRRPRARPDLRISLWSSCATRVHLLGSAEVVEKRGPRPRARLCLAEVEMAWEVIEGDVDLTSLVTNMEEKSECKVEEAMMDML